MGADLEEELRLLVRGFKGELPSKDIEMVDELIVVGESVIAIENLCTQLYEHSIRLSEAQHQELESVGRMLGIRPVAWERLSLLTDN